MKINRILLLLLSFVPFVGIAQSDSLRIDFDYNRENNPYCSYWYAMNHLYQVPKRDTFSLNIPEFCFIQPIEQSFCNVLTVSAFRHEMTLYPIYEYDQVIAC